MTDTQRALEDLIELLNSKDQYRWDWGTDGSKAVSFLDSHIQTIYRILQEKTKARCFEKEGLEMPEEIFVDKDYPITLENRFSLKEKDRQKYARVDRGIQ